MGFRPKGFFNKLSETLSEEWFLEVVRGILNHDDRGLVRWYAAQVLSEVRDNRAVLALTNALNDEHEQVQAEAAVALAKLRAGEPVLIKALNDDDSTVRSNAASTLGQFGDHRALPALIKALNDDNNTVRDEAAQALGKLGNNRAVPALINALKDDDGRVRLSAASTLGKLGDKRAIPALIETIGDDNQDIEIKFEVVKALLKLSRSTHK